MYCASVTMSRHCGPHPINQEELRRRSTPAMDGMSPPSNRTGFRRDTTSTAHRAGSRQSNGSRLPNKNQTKVPNSRRTFFRPTRLQAEATIDSPGRRALPSRVVLHRELVRIRVRQGWGAKSAVGMATITRRNTWRIHRGGALIAARRVLFVSCRSSWR